MVSIVVAAIALVFGYFLYARMVKMKSKPSVVLGAPMPVVCNVAEVSSTASSRAGNNQEVELGAAPEVVVDDDESKI